MTDHDSTTRSSILRPVLWLLLIVSGGANAAMSTIAASRGDSATVTAVGAGFGAIALASAAALIVHHYRTRRQS
ncbi:hypothetical protein [Symbioplanes lichenis]|uniref:hypothetical protein n=1 Tax=Symbioplanes lichenis TaxID=1629072 RepID=UPI00273A4C3C|nr:hypothetical protein [Actinoplanes lichenis]